MFDNKEEAKRRMHLFLRTHRQMAEGPTASNLTEPQRYCLATIGVNHGVYPITEQSLTATLGVPQNTIADSVNALVEHGYLSAELSSPQGSRHLRLTPEGEREFISLCEFMSVHTQPSFPYRTGFDI